MSKIYQKITDLIGGTPLLELANYEKNAAMHIVLVYRGDDTSAEKFLKAQDAYLEKNSRNGG